MKRIRNFLRPKDLLLILSPLVVLGLLLGIGYRFVDPAPPNHMVIATGDDEGDYQAYAKRYQEIMKTDGITLEIRPSEGAAENLKLISDPKSGVDVGFVQDGLGSTELNPGVVSLGSLYYEPMWIFCRSENDWKRLSNLQGKRIAVGAQGSGTLKLSMKLLEDSGITEKNAKLVPLGWKDGAEALKKGEVDVAFLMATAEDSVIAGLMEDKRLRLMDLDQAEATERRLPFLHHLVLPHGAIDIKRNIPDRDTNMVAATATLLAKDELHPALNFLILKAASQVHADPGIFETKGEFPIDKDFQFPLGAEARHYYKIGTPFWQKHLPFWLATIVERMILVIIPILALIMPVARSIPKFYQWRIRRRIYRQYGELKYLETQVHNNATQEVHDRQLEQLDAIENRVYQMKLPLEFSDHMYSLRGHIDFVRERLRRSVKTKKKITG